MHLLNYLFPGKQDLINSGLNSFLNITQPDKVISKDVFKNKFPDIPKETIDSFFIEFENLYGFTETYLLNLSKYQEDKKQVKKEFGEAVANKYKWVDKPNMERLYDVCCFNLR